MGLLVWVPGSRLAHLPQKCCRGKRGQTDAARHQARTCATYTPYDHSTGFRPIVSLSKPSVAPFVRIGEPSALARCSSRLDEVCFAGLAIPAAPSSTIAASGRSRAIRSPQRLRVGSLGTAHNRSIN
jgi:hypothetical protein